MMTTREEKVLNDATICFLNNGDKILLGRKAAKIGVGKFNGYGGGIEDGETPEECAVREIFEETGGVETTVQDLEKVAEVHFHNTKTDGERFTCKCHVYLVHMWFGTPKATNEMYDLRWFHKSALPPEEDMMPADPDWMPVALSGKKIIAHAYLGPFQEEKLQETEITIVDSFDE